MWATIALAALAAAAHGQLQFASPTALPWYCPSAKCRYGGSSLADSFYAWGGDYGKYVIGSVNTTLALSTDGGRTWAAEGGAGMGPGNEYLVSDDTFHTIGE